MAAIAIVAPAAGTAPRTGTAAPAAAAKAPQMGAAYASHASGMSASPIGVDPSARVLNRTWHLVSAPAPDSAAVIIAAFPPNHLLSNATVRVDGSGKATLSSFAGAAAGAGAGGDAHSGTTQVLVSVEGAAAATAAGAVAGMGQPLVMAESVQHGRLRKANPNAAVAWEAGAPAAPAAVASDAQAHATAGDAKMKGTPPLTSLASPGGSAAGTAGSSAKGERVQRVTTDSLLHALPFDDILWSVRATAAAHAGAGAGAGADDEDLTMTWRSAATPTDVWTFRTAATAAGAGSGAGAGDASAGGAVSHAPAKHHSDQQH